MRWKLGIAVAALAFVLAACYAAMRPTPVFSTVRLVSIHKGDSMASAARRLERAGVIRSSLVFILYAELTGNESRIKPGDYAFRGGERLTRVLHHLVNGDFMAVTVAIPEGMTAHQIGERLQLVGLLCGNEFSVAALRGPIPHALGLGPLGAEGLLFPATYRFSPLATADQVVAAMLERFYSIMTPRVEQRMFELGIDQRQLVTLASIVEREAKAPGERRLIASVFYNRLRLGMPLQSDPTAQYNFEGETERALIAVHAPSAFNTYSIAGLPPGPISNPGLPAIEAALYPARTDYLYFVARSDGTHIFSRSLKEHERAIQEVRRAGVGHRQHG